MRADTGYITLTQFTPLPKTGSEGGRGGFTELGWFLMFRLKWTRTLVICRHWRFRWQWASVFPGQQRGYRLPCQEKSIDSFSAGKCEWFCCYWLRVHLWLLLHCTGEYNKISQALHATLHVFTQDWSLSTFDHMVWQKTYQSWLHFKGLLGMFWSSMCHARACLRPRDWAVSDDICDRSGLKATWRRKLPAVQGERCSRFWSEPLRVLIVLLQWSAY